MTDYIKRDAVVDYLDSNNMPWRDWVKDIPTADVVDVIRCRDCKYFENNHVCLFNSRFGTIETTEDDYCSKGEREEA